MPGKTEQLLVHKEILVMKRSFFDTKETDTKRC